MIIIIAGLIGVVAMVFVSSAMYLHDTSPHSKGTKPYKCMWNLQKNY